MTQLPDIDLYVDSADFDAIRETSTIPAVRGFTTNPSLIARIGIRDYGEYARQALELVKGLPISFEVLSDEPGAILREARIIQGWGSNVYVKLPVINADGKSNGELINRLSEEGVALNVTTVFTPEQAEIAATHLHRDAPALVSVFAGRIADVGVDPIPIVKACRDMLSSLPRAHLLWASTREIYNIWQAASAGCRIITVPPAMVRRLSDVGTDLTVLSRDAVRIFMDDIAQSGVRFTSDREV